MRNATNIPMHLPIGLALALLLATSAPTQAGWRNYPRNQEVPKQFQREHPCPSTGRTYGGCPGYIRDHTVPLCAHGADSPANMQWQTRQDAHEKDEREWALCHSLRRQHR